MPDRPSKALETPRLLYAQFIFALALSLLYCAFTLPSFIFAPDIRWGFLPATMMISHAFCALSLWRCIKRKVYAGVLLRLMVGLCLLLSLLIASLFYRFCTDSTQLTPSNLAGDNLPYFTYGLMSLLLVLFPLLSLIYTYTYEIKAYLYYITLHDGEFE